MTISDAQFAAWLRTDAPRVVLAELAFAYESGGNVATGMLYFADRAYRTEAADSPASVRYHAALKACPRFRRSIPWQRPGGRSEVSISDLEIVNSDGAYDYLLETILDGYECRFYLGAPAGTPGWSRADFRLVYVAVAESVAAPDHETIVVRLKDKRLLVDREILGEMVGGSGPESTLYLPLYWGSHFNVEARLYDAATDQYAVMSGTGSLTYDVRDQGLSLAEPAVTIMALSTPTITADAGTDGFTKTAHGLSVNDVVAFEQDFGLGGGYVAFSPFAGVTSGQQFWVVSVPTADTFWLSATKGGTSIDVTGATYLGSTAVGVVARMRVRRWYDDLANTGRIELSSTPAGRVTVDLLASSTYVLTPFALAKHLIETYANVAAADIDSAAFSAADTALDAKVSVGYVNYHVAVRENAIDAIDKLVGSVFGWWGQDRIGKITCGLVDVSGIAAATADRSLALGDLLADLAIENEPPGISRVNVEYGLNHTIQTDGLAETVDDEARRTYASRYRYTQRSSAPSGTAYATNKPLYHKTLVEGEPQPAAEMDSTRFGSDTALPISGYADELAADLGPMRQVIRARVPLDFYDADLGDVLEITVPRYGLDAGENARIVGIEVDLTDEVIELEMVRQFTPDITTSAHP